MNGIARQLSKFHDTETLRHRALSRLQECSNPLQTVGPEQTLALGLAATQHPLGWGRSCTPSCGTCEASRGWRQWQITRPRSAPQSRNRTPTKHRLWSTLSCGWTPRHNRLHREAAPHVATVPLGRPQNSAPKNQLPRLLSLLLLRRRRPFCHSADEVASIGALLVV